MNEGVYESVPGQETIVSPLTTLPQAQNIGSVVPPALCTEAEDSGHTYGAQH